MRVLRSISGVFPSLVGGVLSLALSATLLAIEDWETRVDENGVIVQTRDVAGSDFQAFRGLTELAVAPEAVLARLQDFPAYTEWFPDTIEARPIILEDGQTANYVRTDAPWPVKDRDAIYTQSILREPGLVRVDIGVAPKALADVEGVVRVQAAQGSWTLRTRADGGTSVAWEFHLEPGGAVPSRLANKRVVETPRKALMALRAFFNEV